MLTLSWHVLLVVFTIVLSGCAGHSSVQNSVLPAESAMGLNVFAQSPFLSSHSLVLEQLSDRRVLVRTQIPVDSSRSAIDQSSLFTGSRLGYVSEAIRPFLFPFCEAFPEASLP